MKLTDKEKTAEILKRLQIMNTGFMADNFIKIPEFRLGSGYDGFSQQSIDLFAVSPNKSNRAVCFEIKVSRSDFKNDIKKEDKQTPARCFSNEFYYCTPKGLLKKEEVPVWAGLIEFDLEQEPQEDCFRYMNVNAVYVKKAPIFDKVQPTWGMIVSAYRNGFRQGCKSTPIERYKEGIISFEELKQDD